MREEARLLASVRHANVVSLLGMGHEPSGAPFLVLELIDGADLRVLAKAVARQSDPGQPGPAGVLPDKVAVHLGCALLRALAAVQRALPGLVHRDVTPHNVLVSNEGEIKLTDFGIALALDRARWTRPSVVKGKFGYMAPEQIRGEPLDVRSDLFACGVILFELLARRRPWFVPGEPLDEILAIERGEIASIVECRPHLDRVLASAIDRLLALDKRDRFPTCDAALRALAPFAAGDFGSLRLAAIVDAVLPTPRRLAVSARAAPGSPNPRRGSTPAPLDRGRRTARRRAILSHMDLHAERRRSRRRSKRSSREVTVPSRGERRSADIFCPDIDLSARAGIHYGRRQIILGEWIDPCLFHHVQCKTSDTCRRRPQSTRFATGRLAPISASSPAEPRAKP